jgi:hypothetical protein
VPQLQGLLEGSALAPLIETVPLLPVPLDRVPRLVEGPAMVAGLTVEKGLAEQIMRDVESPEALALLAYTLSLLYARCKDHKLTLAAYLALGDAHRKLNPVQNSIRLAADQAIAGIKPSKEELAALRDAFVPHLVRLRLDDAKRVRQPARRADLPRDAERPLRTLIEARLLSARTDDNAATEGERLGEAVVEVTHEALFEAWPTLRAWLDEEQNFLADLARLKDAHETWEKASERDKPQTLLGGLLLSRARDWLVKYPRRFLGRSTEPLRNFIVLSHKTARRRKLRAQALVGGLVVTVAAVLATWRYEQTLAHIYDQTVVPAKQHFYWFMDLRRHVLTTQAERALRPDDPPFKECTKCPEMVVVPAEEFTMGSPDGEKGHRPDEGPQHKVVFRNRFAVAKFELTREEWDACIDYGDCDRAVPPGYVRTGGNDGLGPGRYPAIEVSWNDAKTYVAWLSRITGKSYRLLSEAEWEYAARARSQTAYPWGNEIGEANANMAAAASGTGSRPLP